MIQNESNKMEVHFKSMYKNYAAKKNPNQNQNTKIS